MLLGALYRAELARELQTLGYGIRLTHGDGRFEVAHISDSQVKTFSHRSAAIEAYLKEHKGLERDEASAWDKKLVAVLTRDKKTAVDRAHLRDEWQRLSREHGIDYRMPARAPTGPTKKDLSPIVAQAVAHLSERQAVFHHQALLQATLERGVGAANLEEVEAALYDAVERGELVRDGERFTTPAAQEMERDILAIESRGRSSLQAIYRGERAALHAQLSAGLNDGQKEAVLGMLLSTHRAIGIQGRAGAGKTTLLKAAARQARACGYAVKGLAPSASAARQLAGTGIDAVTIASFMHASSKGLSSNVLLIVDEAGMISTRQMHVILSEAEKAGSRVVLVGDTSQLQSVEAGKPFAQLQANGMRTCVVSEIQRQKNPLLKQAVEMAVDGQVAMAVELLGKHIHEIPDAAERFERIASDYVALPDAERAATRVIAGTRYARNEINHAIRDKLGLVDQGQEFTLLERKDLTEAQARSILNYEMGDVLLAEADYPSLGIKRGETVKVVERQDCFILIEREDGGRTTWQPALATKLAAYVPAARQLAIGDMVRITGNDRARGLINGDLARVASVEAERQALTLCFEDGREITLDGRRPLLLDHGYCSTVYSAQGQTCDRVLIEADAHSLTANENSFYVAISRARHHAQIYTDDHELLPLSMGREVKRETALDVKVKPAVLADLSL